MPDTRTAERAGAGRLPMLVLLALVATSGRTHAGKIELPGVGAGTITPETLFSFTGSIKMIDPPAGLPQKWFSAEAEFVGTVVGATSTSVSLVEGMTHSEHVGRSIRVSGSSAAAGQIRHIASNSASQIEVTPPFDPLPEPGDAVEIFTGQLPPGRWDGECSPADPCLDFYQIHVFGSLEGGVWIWLDAGDVWDSDDEWCDATHSPPGRCVLTTSFWHRFMVGYYDDPEDENEIHWGLSSTDLTGRSFPVIDCDSGSYYPPVAGGLFENQNGTGAPPQDIPTSWLLVQGIETRCWNRPAPGLATSKNEWGEGTCIYRQEFSGKILAIHNRHGDLWDGASMVLGNGSLFTQGDRYMGGVILVDVEVNTADYLPMAGQCIGTNVPYRSCQGTEFTGQGRGELGDDLRPTFLSMFGSGDVLWIGGNATPRNGSGGVYTGYPRDFVGVSGFNDALTSSGVGGTQRVTLVNLKLAGAPDETAPANVVFALPLPGNWGTTFEIRILNSLFTDMSNGASVVRFNPGWNAERAQDTSLVTEWVNVSVKNHGSVFTKDPSVVDGLEIDGGFDWTGRCLFIDGAHPVPNFNRIIDIRSGNESLGTRCMGHSIDVEGWIDGDDVVNQFNLCQEDVVSYASDAMAGTMLRPENAGGVNGWKIFSQGNSGDWGGEGVDIDATTELEVSPEVQNTVLDACDHAQTYPLGQTLPVGFISTADNLISNISLGGTRNLGFNSPEDWPHCEIPGDPLYIETAAHDVVGHAVMYYSDPNPPAEVTGYNIYRASAPTGPWVLIASNVGDMDAVRSGVQYIDSTGDPVTSWYFKVAAVNATCAIEGP